MEHTHLETWVNCELEVDFCPKLDRNPVRLLVLRMPASLNIERT